MAHTEDVELDAPLDGSSHRAAFETSLLPPSDPSSSQAPATRRPWTTQQTRLKRTMARTLLPSLTGFVAALTSLTILIFVVMMAVVLTLQRRKTCILALVAATIEVLSCCTVVYMLVCHIRQRNTFGGSGELNGGRGRHSLMFALGMLPSIVAGTVVGALLGWANTSRGEVPSYVLGLKISTYLFVSFILWGVSVVTQILFFACLAWASHPLPKSSLNPSITSQEKPQTVEPSRPTTSTTVQSNPFQEEPSSTNSPSAAPSEVTSLRSSLSIKTRPTTAKSKFISRQHAFQSRSSLDSPARTRFNQDEAFDSWDTSGVGSHIRETVLHSSPVVKSRPSPLEPIPGSRSPSPAKALEGPFFGQGPSESAPSSPLPQPSISRPQSRARSASSEDHIHPLFRTSSPAPPNVSSGTNVTAAPSAGQMINQRILKRMRSGSLPSSPSPLIRSESFSDFMASRTPTSPRTPISPSQEGVQPFAMQEQRPLMPGRFPSAISAASQMSEASSQVSQDTIISPVPIINCPVPRLTAPLLPQP